MQPLRVGAEGVSETGGQQVSYTATHIWRWTCDRCGAHEDQQTEFGTPQALVVLPKLWSRFTLTGLGQANPQGMDLCKNCGCTVLAVAASQR